MSDVEKMQAEEPLFTNRSLAQLVGPLIVEQLLAVTIGMMDTLMVTRVGEQAISAISLVDVINVLLIQVFAALTTGGAIVAAQYIGGRDQRGACDTARQLTHLSTIIAAVVGAVAICFNAPILHLIYGNLEPEVMQGARTYFYLSAMSYPFLALYSSGAALFRSMGNSRVSMFVSLVANLANVGGNALLIYGFNMGVAGAGIASLASRALASVVVTSMICNRQNPIHVDGLFRWEFKPDIARRILRLGIPNGLEGGVFQIGKLLVAGLVSTFGTTVIAANAVCDTTTGLVNIIGGAIGLAMLTVVGQCMGAKRPDQAIQNVKKLMICAYAMGAVLNLLLNLFIQPIVGLFNLSEEAVDVAVEVLLARTIPAIMIWPVAFPFANVLRAAGDIKYTMWVSMLSMFAFRVGSCYLLANGLGMGLMGVWLAMYIDWGGRAACFLWRFFSGKWRTQNVIG